VTSSWKGKSTVSFMAAQQRLTALDTALAELADMQRQARWRYLEELANLIDRDWSALRLGSWDCVGSPTGRCVYDMDSDEMDDECLFCGGPSERK